MIWCLVYCFVIRFLKRARVFCQAHGSGEMVLDAALIHLSAIA